MRAIREQHADALALGIDLHRRAGEAGVAVAVVFDQPAEAAALVQARRVIARRDLAPFASHELRCEAIDAARGGEESRVPRRAAADNERVAVVRLAPDQRL